MASIHVDDIGTAFRASVVDQAGTIVPLTGSDTLKILFQKPNASTVIQTATIYHSGSGIMQYLTQAGDLDQAGNWKIQGYVKQGSNEWYGDEVKIKVLPNIAHVS